MFALEVDRKAHPFVIEDHIPIPSDEGLPCKTRSKYAFLKTMKVGDSFIADNKIQGYNINTLVQSAYGLRGTNGYVFKYRTVSGSPARKLSWVVRLWRIK